jgi:diguanylate cyclase (GGDEF)-like protein
VISGQPEELVLLDALQLGVILLDNEGRLIHWNQWFSEHLAIPVQPPVGERLGDVFPEIVKGRLGAVIDQALHHKLSSILTPGLNRSLLPLCHISVDNTREAMQQLVYITPLEHLQAACLLQIQDMTVVKRRERRLRVQSNQWLDAAYLDPLTTVGNRRRFDHALTELYHKAEKTATPLGLIMLDIDHFKNYNDLYGHQHGDECLCQVAITLEQGLRKQAGDLICRYGGEEFAVLLPGADERTSCAIAERLRKRVHSLKLAVAATSSERHLTISLGVAVAPIPGGLTAEALVNAADRALYRAKDNGRNRFMYYDFGSRQVRTGVEPRADMIG